MPRLLLALATAGSCCLGLMIATPAGAEVEPQVIGGKPVNAGKYGFVVSIEMNGDQGPQAFCSGSLISPRYILTAAHCLALSDGEDNQRLAQNGLSVRFNNLINRPKIAVTRTAYWKDFNPYLMAEKPQSDLALLELASDGPTTPVQLAAVSPAMVKRPVTILGYGHKNEKQDKMSPRLIAGQTRIRHPRACSYRDRDSNIRAFATNEICTTAKMPRLKAGACSGDSGGPLMSANKLIGVTSWSIDSNCEAKAKTRNTVFARVSTAERWLRQQTGVSLFGLEPLTQITAAPPNGSVWVEEANQEQISVTASAPDTIADKNASQAISVTVFEMQIYYRDKKTLVGFDPRLGSAQFKIADDGQSATLSAPGSQGVCSAEIGGEKLSNGSVGVRCPGGDWQATIVANLIITLHNNDTVEKVLSTNVSAAAPEATIDIPQSVRQLDIKQMKVYLFARLYNEVDNGATASSDISQIAVTAEPPTEPSH